MLDGELQTVVGAPHQIAGGVVQACRSEDWCPGRRSSTGPPRRARGPVVTPTHPINRGGAAGRTVWAAPDPEGAMLALVANAADLAVRYGGWDPATDGVIMPIRLYDGCNRIGRLIRERGPLFMCIARHVHRLGQSRGGRRGLIGPRYSPRAAASGMFMLLKGQGMTLGRLR